MKQVSTAMGLAAVLVFGQAGAASAETAAAQAAPAQAAPSQENPAVTPPADPRVERQRKGAAKLAGMVRFVDAACPEATPDYDRFKQVIAAMGVDIKDLEQGPLMMDSLRYTEAYRKDVAESCKRAFEHFGETGTTVPGLIAHKARDAAPATPDKTAPAPTAR